MTISTKGFVHLDTFLVYKVPLRQECRECFFLQRSVEELKASWDYSSHHSGK